MNTNQKKDVLNDMKNKAFFGSWPWAITAAWMEAMGIETQQVAANFLHVDKSMIGHWKTARRKMNDKHRKRCIYLLEAEIERIEEDAA